MPTPNASGINRADQRPIEDGVIALGGSATRLNANTVSTSEAALINAAGRHGVTADIRNIVAAEDAEFRKRNKGKVLERWVGTIRLQPSLPTTAFGRIRRTAAPTQNWGYAHPTAPPKGE